MQSNQNPQQQQSFTGKIKESLTHGMDVLKEKMGGHHEGPGMMDKAKEVFTGNSASAKSAHPMQNRDPGTMFTTGGMDAPTYNADYKGPEPAHRLHSDNEPINRQ